MSDREQTRRDAPKKRENARQGIDGCEAVWPFDQIKAYLGMKDWAELLLAELEQAERETAAYKETLDNVAEDAAARVQQAERERDEAISACVSDIELEQTRRERDEAQEEADQLDNRLDLQNLRLAKMDSTLVEALREIVAYGTSPDGIDANYQAVIAEHALAAWEQE